MSDLPSCGITTTYAGWGNTEQVLPGPLATLHGAVSVTRGRHAIDSARALRRIRLAHGDGCYPVIRSESPHTLRRLDRTTMSTSIELEGNGPLPVLPSKPDPVALVRPTRFLVCFGYAVSKGAPFKRHCGRTCCDMRHLATG